MTVPVLPFAAVARAANDSDAEALALLNTLADAGWEIGLDLCPGDCLLLATWDDELLECHGADVQAATADLQRRLAGDGA